MKILTSIAALAMLCSVACTNQPKNQFTVIGDIGGLPDSTIVKLDLVDRFYGEESINLGQAMVIDGHFQISDTITDPRAVTLRTGNYRDGMVSMIITPGTIKVTGTLRDAKVEGSALTDKYISLLSVQDKVDSLYSTRDEKFADVYEASSEAYQKNDKKKMEEIKQSDRYKAMLEYETWLYKTSEEEYNRVFAENSDSFFGPLMMVSVYSYFTSEQRPIFDAMSTEAKESYYGKMVEQELYPIGKMGSKAPEFTVTDENGKQYTLTELCAGKKYVLVDFWASWCGPCRREIPNLKKLYKEYSDKGFQIVSISIDKRAEDWQKALKSEQMVWPNFLDNSGISDLYKVQSIPAMFLLDANACLVADDLRGASLQAKLSELFSE